ncbi:MAG: hypothetical protein ACI9ZX_002540, partial [Algoriphagus sp.]
PTESHIPGRLISHPFHTHKEIYKTGKGLYFP